MENFTVVSVFTNIPSGGGERDRPKRVKGDSRKGEFSCAILPKHAVPLVRHRWSVFMDRSSNQTRTQ